MFTSHPSSSSRRVRGGLVLLIALSLLLPGLVGPAGAGTADQVGATFGLMLKDVVEAFRPAEGLVVAAEGDRLFIDLTGESGIQPGQEYAVFRKGEVFRHPINGRPLGRYEDVLGYAQIVRLHPQYSEAVFVPTEGKPGPEAEDGVRITRGRIRVAVAPATDLTKSNTDLRRVPFMIAHALEQTKRFQAADPSAVQDYLLGRKTRGEELLVSPDKAKAFGQALEVSGWLIPMLIERRGVTYLDITWISAVTGTALFSRRAALTRSEDTAEQRFPWEPVPTD